MLSEKQQSARSPTESNKTDSVRAGPSNRLVSRQSQRSSISEEDDKDAATPPPPPPLPSSFGQQSFRAPKKSSSRSSTSSSSGTPSQATLKPTLGNLSANKTTGGVSLLRPTFLRESSDEKRKSSRPILNQTTTPSESKRGIGALFGAVSARDIENEKPPATTTFTSIFGGGGGRVGAGAGAGGKPNQSIFEKVDTHGGGTTYLGSGTYNQLEDCISNCLSKNQTHTEYEHHTPKYEYPHKSLTRASVLEDYSYDGIISPHHHISHSSSDHHYHHHVPYSSSDHHHHYSHHYSDSDHHHHHHSRDHKLSAAELSLDEIRQVNDALGKCGVPVFSHHEHHHNQNKPRPVGDIISACQQLLADPALRAQSDGAHAVQHVWDNLHNHSPQTNMYGYASPAVRGVASHLFNHTNQPPYDPVHSVASTLFGSPAPYNPAPANLFGNPAPYNPPPPTNPFGNPAPYNPPPPANLFGNPAPYNPPPPTNPFGNPAPYNYPPPNPYGNPQPNPPSSAGQSVISRLFGGS